MVHKYYALPVLLYLLLLLVSILLFNTFRFQSKQNKAVSHLPAPELPDSMIAHFQRLIQFRGRHVLTIQGIGMKDTKRQVMLYASGRFDIDMYERVTSLKEVIFPAQKPANVRKAQLGTERLTIKAIRQVPAIFGEADILKAVLMLPGVKTVGEASTGFNVAVLQGMDENGNAGSDYCTFDVR